MLRGHVEIGERLALISIGWNCAIEGRSSFDFVRSHISDFTAALLTPYIIAVFLRKLLQVSRQVFAIVCVQSSFCCRVIMNRLVVDSDGYTYTLYILDAPLLSCFAFSGSSLSSSLLRTFSFLRTSRRQCWLLVETANSRWRTVNEDMVILEAAWN